MSQKFFYVGNKTSSKSGVLTAVSEIQPNGKLKIAFAFCSPKDQFNRKIGRKIALGRLTCDRSSFITDFTGHSSNDICKIFNEYNSHPGSGVYIPRLWKNRVLVSTNKGIAYEKRP